MRPYFSIIKDSFRAAMASRVLYVLLVCITILLILLAPIWIKEDLAWQISSPQHVRNPDALVKRLGGDGPNEDEKLMNHLWKMFPDDLRGELTRFYDKDQEDEVKSDPGQEKLGDQLARQRMWGDSIRELNRIIENEKLYDAEVFKDRTLSKEANGFVEMGPEKLNDAQRRRLNRLLVERTLGVSVIRPGPSSSLSLSYAIWSPQFLTMNVTNPEMHQTIASWLPYILDKFVIAIGLLIAVLITASLIPDMLQSSSLNLLLSKPITRWGLLLAKFVGGCAFVAILTTYLFFGIWFLLGVRIGYWDKAILLSIPVYIFVFAIYFSVSTLAGVMFRNTIVSIVLTLIFWGVCFLVGMAHSNYQSFVKASDIVVVSEVNDEIFMVDLMSVPYRYDQDENKWEMTMADEATQMFSSIMYGVSFVADPETMDGRAAPIGPNHDPINDVVVLGQVDMQRPQTMQRRKLTASNQQKDWEPINAGYMPSNTIELFSSEELGLVAVTGLGNFLRLSENPLIAAENAQPKTSNENDPEPTVDPENEIDPDEKKADPAANASSSPSSTASTNGKMRLASNQQTSFEFDEDGSDILNLELFHQIGPNRRVDIQNANYVDFNPSNNEIAVYQHGIISIFEFVDDQYKFSCEIIADLDVEASMSAWITYRKNILLVALGNGELVTIDRNSFDELNTYTPESRSAVRSVAASPDGRWFAVTYRNGHLWILDNDNPQDIKKANIRGQGNIASGTFNADGQIWVSSNIDQITLYDPSNWSVVKSIKPKSGVLSNSYRYGVQPLYRAFPKPGEFYKLVSHLSDSGEVKYNRGLDLTLQPAPKHPWDPFRSGVIFMAIVLGISCFIFHRQEY